MISCLSIALVIAAKITLIEENDIIKENNNKNQSENIVTSENIDIYSSVIIDEPEILESSTVSDVPNEKPSSDIKHIFVKINELFEKGINERDSNSISNLLEVIELCESINTVYPMENFNLYKKLMNANYGLFERYEDNDLKIKYLEKAKKYSYEAMTIAEDVSQDALNSCVFVYSQSLYELTKIQNGNNVLDSYEECLEYFKQISEYKPMNSQSYIISIYRLMYEKTKDCSYLDRLIQETDLSVLSGQYYYNAKKNISDSEYLIALSDLKVNNRESAKIHFDNAKKHILDLQNYKDDEYLLMQLVNIEYYQGGN